MQEKLREVIAAAIAARYTAIEEEIVFQEKVKQPADNGRSKLSGPKAPRYALVFAATEQLAFLHAQCGRFLEAHTIYHEIDLARSPNVTPRRFRSLFRSFGFHEPNDEIPILLDLSRKRYAAEIASAAVSYFDFRCYSHARQQSLLIQLNYPEECAMRSLEFIRRTSQDFRDCFEHEASQGHNTAMYSAPGVARPLVWSFLAAVNSAALYMKLFARKFWRLNCFGPLATVMTDALKTPSAAEHTLYDDNTDELPVPGMDNSGPSLAFLSTCLQHLTWALNQLRHLIFLREYVDRFWLSAIFESRSANLFSLKLWHLPCTPNNGFPGIYDYLERSDSSITVVTREQLLTLLLERNGAHSAEWRLTQALQTIADSLQQIRLSACLVVSEAQWTTTRCHQYRTGRAVVVATSTNAAEQEKKKSLARTFRSCPAKQLRLETFRIMEHLRWASGYFQDEGWIQLCALTRALLCEAERAAGSRAEELHSCYLLSHRNLDRLAFSAPASWAKYGAGAFTSSGPTSRRAGFNVLSEDTPAVSQVARALSLDSSTASTLVFLLTRGVLPSRMYFKRFLKLSSTGVDAGSAAGPADTTKGLSKSARNRLPSDMSSRKNEKNSIGSSVSGMDDTGRNDSGRNPMATSTASATQCDDTARVQLCAGVNLFIAAVVTRSSPSHRSKLSPGTTVSSCDNLGRGPEPASRPVTLYDMAAARFKTLGLNAGGHIKTMQETRPYDKVDTKHKWDSMARLLDHLAQSLPPESLPLLMTGSFKAFSLKNVDTKVLLSVCQAQLNQPAIVVQSSARPDLIPLSELRTFTLAKYLVHPDEDALEDSSPQGVPSFTYERSGIDPAAASIPAGNISGRNQRSESHNSFWTFPRKLRTSWSGRIPVPNSGIQHGSIARSWTSRLRKLQSRVGSGSRQLTRKSHRGTPGPMSDEMKSSANVDSKGLSSVPISGDYGFPEDGRTEYLPNSLGPTSGYTPGQTRQPSGSRKTLTKADSLLNQLDGVEDDVGTRLRLLRVSAETDQAAFQDQTEVDLADTVDISLSVHSSLCRELPITVVVLKLTPYSIAVPGNGPREKDEDSLNETAIAVSTDIEPDVDVAEGSVEQHLMPKILSKFPTGGNNCLDDARVPRKVQLQSLEESTEAIYFEFRATKTSSDVLGLSLFHLHDRTTKSRYGDKTSHAEAATLRTGRTFNEVAGEPGGFVLLSPGVSVITLRCPALVIGTFLVEQVHLVSRFCVLSQTIGQMPSLDIIRSVSIDVPLIRTALNLVNRAPENPKDDSDEEEQCTPTSTPTSTTQADKMSSDHVTKRSPTTNTMARTARRRTSILTTRGLIGRNMFFGALNASASADAAVRRFQQKLPASMIEMNSSRLNCGDSLEALGLFGTFLRVPILRITLPTTNQFEMFVEPVNLLPGLQSALPDEVSCIAAGAPNFLTIVIKKTSSLCCDKASYVTFGLVPSTRLLALRQRVAIAWNKVIPIYIDSTVIDEPQALPVFLDNELEQKFDPKIADGGRPSSAFGAPNSTNSTNSTSSIIPSHSTHWVQLPRFVSTLFLLVPLFVIDCAENQSASGFELVDIDSHGLTNLPLNTALNLPQRQSTVIPLSCCGCATCGVTLPPFSGMLKSSYSWETPADFLCPPQNGHSHSPGSLPSHGKPPTSDDVLSPLDGRDNLDQSSGNSERSISSPGNHFAFSRRFSTTPNRRRRSISVQRLSPPASSREVLALSPVQERRKSALSLIASENLAKERQLAVLVPKQARTTSPDGAPNLRGNIFDDYQVANRDLHNQLALHSSSEDLRFVVTCRYALRGLQELSARDDKSAVSAAIQPVTSSDGTESDSSDASSETNPRDEATKLGLGLLGVTDIGIQRAQLIIPGEDEGTLPQQRSTFTYEDGNFRRRVRLPSYIDASAICLVRLRYPFEVKQNAIKPGGRRFLASSFRFSPLSSDCEATVLRATIVANSRKGGAGNSEKTQGQTNSGDVFVPNCTAKTPQENLSVFMHNFSNICSRPDAALGNRERANPSKQEKGMPCAAEQRFYTLLEYVNLEDSSSCDYFPEPFSRGVSGPFKIDHKATLELDLEISDKSKTNVGKHLLGPETLTLIESNRRRTIENLIFTHIKTILENANVSKEGVSTLIRLNPATLGFSGSSPETHHAMGLTLRLPVGAVSKFEGSPLSIRVCPALSAAVVGMPFSVTFEIESRTSLYGILVRHLIHLRRASNESDSKCNLISDDVNAEMHRSPCPRTLNFDDRLLWIMSGSRSGLTEVNPHAKKRFTVRFVPIAPGLLKFPEVSFLVCVRPPNTRADVKENMFKPVPKEWVKWTTPHQIMVAPSSARNRLSVNIIDTDSREMFEGEPQT